MGRERRDEMNREVLQQGTKRHYIVEPLFSSPKEDGGMGSGLVEKAKEALQGRKARIDKAVKDSGG